MGFKMGIVGLPNVGKSTLFNALTQTAAAEAANYPFCTIEPNVGEVGVPDARLDKLAAIAGSKEIIPTRLTFVDIAGLVRGASKGEGLGNKFLSHIREVDAVAYVLRCFEDGDVTHVENRIDPIADAEMVETELMLADLESLEKRGSQIEKKAKTGDKEAKAQFALIEKALVMLREGKPARLASHHARGDADLPRPAAADLQARALRLQRRRGLGRRRQRLFERASRRAPKRKARNPSSSRPRSRASSPASRRRIATRSSSEMGLAEPGLNRLIRAGYALLDLVTYFTVGPKEARAWTVDARHQGAAGGGRHPHRLRKGLHPRRDHRLPRLRLAQRRDGRQGRRQDAARRQGVRGPGRRRDALPVCELATFPSPLGERARIGGVLVRLQPSSARRILPGRKT